MHDEYFIDFGNMCKFSHQLHKGGVQGQSGLFGTNLKNKFY